MEHQPTNSETKAPKKSKGLIIGIIIGVVVLIAGLIVGGIFLFKGIMGSGSAEAVAFIDEIKNGRLTSAYDFFSPELKDVQDFKTFSRQINTLDLDPSCNYEPQSAEMGTSIEIGRTKETSGEIKCQNKTFSAEFEFVEIDGAYKLYSYSIKPTDNNTTINNNTNSGIPKDLDALKSAMRSLAAINCSVTNRAEDTTALIQSTKGWGKFKMVTESDEDEMTFLALKGDGLYTWGQSYGYKMDYDQTMIDTIIDNMNVKIDTDNDAMRNNITFTCSNPSKADFSLPHGIEFMSTDDDEYNYYY